jgi:hypothetical protein
MPALFTPPGQIKLAQDGHPPPLAGETSASITYVARMAQMLYDLGLTRNNPKAVTSSYSKSQGGS